MKHALFYFCLLSAASSINASQAPTPNPLTLTDEENKCFEWFNATTKQMPSTIQQLCQEDKEVYEKRLKYADDPDAVTRSRNNYADKFLEQVKDNNLPLPYTPRIVKRTILKVVQGLHRGSIKPTDVLTARQHVYADLLTEQDKNTWTPTNYQKNPDQAHAVAQKFADLLAEQLISLKLVADTDEARKAKTEEIYQEKLARFKITYAEQK